MNSLSALANIGTPPPSPARSRVGSESNLLHALPRPNTTGPSNDASAAVASPDEKATMGAARGEGAGSTTTEAAAAQYDEKRPLLEKSPNGPFEEAKIHRRWLYPKRISGGIVAAVGVLLTPFVYTGQYLVSCFYYEEDGRYSMLAPIYHMARPFTRSRRKTAVAQTERSPKTADTAAKEKRNGRTSGAARTRTDRSSRRSLSVASTSTAMTSDSENERPPTRDGDLDFPSRHTRSKSNVSSTGDEIAPAKRSIRIKLHNEDALRQRKAAKQAYASRSSSGQVPAEAAAALKSPTGPVTAASKQLTRFPHAPQPPRPLVPRRQPSFSASGSSAFGPHQKTLIIDLDETLIHSMAKGGRFQTGHMVEVKLQASVGAGGQIIGPQVPILYYVHKRPYCDDFLKKVPSFAMIQHHCTDFMPGQ
jgi:CTD nuclear envelope phosphatase 1